MEEEKQDDGIPFFGVAIVLFINLIIYLINAFAGGLFFAFFGFWFLGYGIYKIFK